MDPDQRRSLTARLVLALIVLFVGVLSMPSQQYVGDPWAVRMATWSVIERGRLDVPEELASTAGERGQYFVQNPDNGLWYSKYGELNTLGYVPAMLVEKALLGRLEPVNDTRTRTHLLNLGNLALSLVLALVLYGLAMLYTERPATVVVFVLATLYATFGWNYLRAQTTELLQWTLYAAFFHQLVLVWRTRAATGPLAAAQVLLLLLTTTKLVYVLLMPLLAGVALLANPRRVVPVLAPLAVTAAVTLGLNELKFGDAFFTGYTQWTREKDLFRGSLGQGLLGFLADPQRSVFLHDPLLLPALAALPAFARRYRAEALLAWLPFLAFLLLHANTTNWAGHWSYGPRYLLPVLTPVTLPAVLAFDWLAERRRAVAAAALALLLAFSVWMQVQVNSLDFFTFYQVEAVVKMVDAPRALAALQRTPFGLLNGQLRRFARTGDYPPFLQEAARELPPEEAAALARVVRARVRPNLLVR